LGIDGEDLANEARFQLQSVFLSLYLRRIREIQHNSLKLRDRETKRELVEQFAAPYLAARNVRGIWLRDCTIFRQNAIGEKNRAVRLTCRSGQQRRDW
jgi:hypothetical protein